MRYEKGQESKNSAVKVGLADVFQRVRPRDGICLEPFNPHPGAAVKLF
jgi:hypothetical protein